MIRASSSCTAGTEYGNYIGVPAAALIVAALVWVFLGGGRKTTRWLGVSLALTTVVLFALSLGEFAPFAPATLARAIPFVSRYRLPSRYTIGVVLFATTLAGWALRELSFDLVTARRGRVVVAALCLLASADLIWRNGSHFAGIFDQRPLDRGFRLLRRSPTLVTDTTIDAFQQDAPMLRALMANRSTFNCYEPLKLAQIEDPNQPLVFGDAGLKIVASEFSPNRIDVTVVGGPEGSRLFVNQSYAPDWQSTLGPVAPGPHFRNISVAVPAGAAGRYAVAFRPIGLASGCFVFALALAASLRWRTAKLPDW